MELRKSLSVLVLLAALALSTSAVAAPISMEEISRRIRGNDVNPSASGRHTGTELMVEFGIASWYDCPTKPENVQKEQLKLKDYIYPVAHKTLPFGTLIKVINPANGKKILTRVIDRGPFITGRIIDLDYHASKALDISGVGNIILKIYLVDPNQVASIR